jgi:hypothetical protein
MKKTTVMQILSSYDQNVIQEQRLKPFALLLAVQEPEVEPEEQS